MPLPSLHLPAFALAGLTAAAGLLVIHLLNRRRYRVVQWAAMDFLREAIFRNRRLIQLRDLLLMLLRMACVVAFGAALARPFFSRSASTAANLDQPVHLVLLVDNSLSMAHEKLDGVLLDDAKAKAKEVIEGLPRGSRVSVLPTCGSVRGIQYDAYAHREDALEALAAIQPVDWATRPQAALDDAKKACDRLSTVPGKRIVLVTDQHADAWPALPDHLKQLPSPLEILQVAPETPENAWVEEVRLRDGVADLQTPVVLVAKIGYRGNQPRYEVPVTLSIDDAIVATKIIKLEAGLQIQEVEFPPYRFDVPVEPGKVTLVPVKVSIPNDRLPLDDHRVAVVPVVAALPVVFIDSVGSDENPKESKYGETWALRRILAPVTSHKPEQQLIQIRHLKPGEVTTGALADARLVVVAGLRDPAGMVPLLKEYVEQGGNLILAAGGDFDPAAWNQEAWTNGLGILPAPLKPEAVGQLPEESSGTLEPFTLDPDSLVHDYFLPEGMTPDDVRGDFGPRVLFFRAVAAEAGAETRQKVHQSVAEYFNEQGQSLAEIDRQLAELSHEQGKPEAGSSPEAAPRQRRRGELETQRAALLPNWLLWHKQEIEEARQPAEQLASRAEPRIVGRYSNGLPFMVQRDWGRGRVLLVTTSLSRSWTSLPVVPEAVWILDRICRSMLEETFPRRTMATDESLVLPVAAAERTARFTLVDPTGRQQTLSVDALEGDRYGITLGKLMRRGIYRINASQPTGAPGGEEATLWSVPLAVNGPAGESDLGVAGSQEGGPVRAGFLESAKAGGLAIEMIQGTDLWKLILAVVLAGLLLEMTLLAWFYRSAEQTA